MLDARRGAIDARDDVRWVQFERPREVGRRPRRVAPVQAQHAPAMNHNRVIGREIRGLREVRIGPRTVARGASQRSD